MASKKHLDVKVIPFLLIGLLIFILYIYFFVGIGDTILIIQQANLFFYFFSFIAVMLNTLFDSLAWQYFLLSLSVKASLRKSFLFVWVGNFVDLLIPAEAISGELSKTYLMSKSSGGNTGKVVASIVSHRILYGAIILGSLIISSISLILRYKLSGHVLNLIILVTAGTGVYLIFLCLLSIREKLAMTIINFLIKLLVFVSRGRWRLDHLKSRIYNTVKAFHEGIEILVEQPRGLAQSTTFSILAWIFSLLISYLVFLSLGQNIPFSVIVIVHSISSSVQTIPLGVPGEVGLLEILMTSLYASLGIPFDISAATAAAATVLIRVSNMWFRILGGFVAIQFVGIKALRRSLN